MGFNSAFKELNAVLYTNLHMYYYYSIVDIHVLFTGQMQGYYIGAMDIFFLCVDHLFGPYTCKWSLEIVLLCTAVSICRFHLRVFCCVDLAFVFCSVRCIDFVCL